MTPPVTPPPTPAVPVRVLVADDQTVVRDGLRLMLGLLESVEVVGTAVDGDDAVRQAVALRPDVVLMDLSMPGCDGVEATARLAQQCPSVRVVVLTTYADDTSVFRALRAGARGYLTKDAGVEEIERAVTTVARGEAVLDPSVQRRLLEALASGAVPSADPDPDRAAEPDPAAGQRPHGLTAREVDVLVRIAEGLSNTEIAAALVLSEATVKTHVNHLLAKTGCRDRAQLVGFAFRTRLVRPPRD